MSWFEEHPNWTAIIFTPVVWAAPWIIGAVLWGGLYPGEDIGDELSWFIIPVGTLVLYGWNLSAKGRTLWWLSLLVFGFVGFIIILVLENRKKAPVYRARAGEVVGQTAGFCPHCGVRLKPPVRNFCPACGKSLLLRASADTAEQEMRQRIEAQKSEILSMIDGVLKPEGGRD